MIERKLTTSFKLTPSELASEFASMDDGEQAEFFSELAAITAEWDKPFCTQLQAVTKNSVLTSEGRYIMEQIGEYGPLAAGGGE